MIEMKRWRTDAIRALAGAVVLAFAAMLAAGEASAQQSEAAAIAMQAQQQESKWIKRCNGTEPDAFCEVSYGKMITIRDRQIWLAVAGLFLRGDEKELFIFTPLGSALQRGLAYRVDTSEPKPAPYVVCVQPQGCQAQTAATDELIEQLKAGSQLQVQFQVGARPPVVSAVSLSGFTAAYDGEPSVIVPPRTAEGGANAQPAGNGAQSNDAAASGGKGDAVAQ